MKKRIAKFIGFKIVELTGAFLVWWGLSCLGYLIFPNADTDFWIKWGLLPVCMGFFSLCVGTLVVVLVIPWIKWNWEKAGE